MAEVVDAPKRGRGRPKLSPEQKKVKPVRQPAEVEPKKPVYKDAQSPEWYAQYVKEKIAYDAYCTAKGKGVIQTFTGERVFRFD